MKTDDFLNILIEKGFVYILRIFFEVKENEYSEIYIGATEQLINRMKAHYKFFSIKKQIKHVQLCYLKFYDKKEIWFQEKKIILMSLEQQNILINSNNQQKYRYFNKIIFKNHIEIYSDAKKMFNAQTSYLRPGAGKRKFIERSKMLGFRVPITHYETLKKIINDFVDNYCREHNLLALEKNND